MSKILTTEQQRSYRDEGVVFPIPVLSPEEVQAYCSACDELEISLGGRPRTVEVRQMHLHFRWAYELATEPRVLDAVEDVLGPDLLIWATELFAKPPQDGLVSIGWHRDEPYMGLAAEQTVTAWIALSDSLPENGCMRVVFDRERREAAKQLPKNAGARQPEVPDELTTCVALRAGEMSLHDVHILHGSGPNRSSQKRVGFAIRFTTPAAPPLAGDPPMILARGENRFGHFRVVDPPQAANAELALAGMRDSARRHLDATLENIRVMRHPVAAR